MLAGVISPPIIIAGQAGANFSTDQAQYLVSTSLIVCGILSSVQITRFHVWRSPYYVGTGLISVVGTSFAIIPVATGAFAQMYKTGYCPTASDGTKLPCPEGYGAILGTACVCALLEIGLSFTSPKYLKKFFPPLVTGPTVALIGISLVQAGFEDWAGGAGSCMARTATSVPLCPYEGAPHALPWGSAQFIGLGFSVFVTIIICERFGSPIMKSCAVVMGLLVGCIIAGATGYFDRSTIDAAPAVSFIWVRTFPLRVYAPIVLPLLAVYIVLMMEAIGDITATCDVSRLEVEGALFDSRIQGGVLADGFNGMLAGLCTITPMSTFAQVCRPLFLPNWISILTSRQNNGVIALTRCANRKAGYAACFFLVVMGIFSKFAAALVAIPSPVLGGMTVSHLSLLLPYPSPNIPILTISTPQTFLFSAVAVSGIRIISTVPFTRRNRFILTASMSLGFGATLVPNWFSYVFTYKGDNHALQGFFNAIVLVLETGFAITAFLAIFLNLILEEEIEDEAASITANEVDRVDDQEEWARIQRGRADGGEKEGDVESGDGTPVKV